jgi:hypothetical protein
MTATPTSGSGPSRRSLTTRAVIMMLAIGRLPDIPQTQDYNTG